jgi:hypothetical protein
MKLKSEGVAGGLTVTNANEYLRQKRASISGYVKDVDAGTVLGDAKIGIRRNDSDKIILSALSSTSTGQYEIKNIPPRKIHTRIYSASWI